jgi:hypothetical protein
MWDFYKLRATVPAEEAFRPVAEGGCPLVRGYRPSVLPAKFAGSPANGADQQATENNG